MSQPHLPSPSAKRRRWQLRHRPVLEPVEERVLPGETLGSLWVFSLDPLPSPLASLFRSADEFPGRPVEAAARGVGLVPPEGNAVPQAAPFAVAADAAEATARWRRATGNSLGMSPFSDLVGQPLRATGLGYPIPWAQGQLRSPAARGGGDTLPSWDTYGHDARHTGLSESASQPLNGIHWQTPVDLDPQFHGGDLLIHYGSPVISAANTVFVPVKTQAEGSFVLEAHSGADGSLLWTGTSDYILPPHNWVPTFSPVLSPLDRVYVPGAGGTVWYRDSPDQPSGTQGHHAFYGIANYDPSYDQKVFINTPLTGDSHGNIYFGFQVTGPTPLHLQSGVARLGPDGTGTWVAASTAAADPTITKVVHNAAPALSNDGSVLYVPVRNANGFGYLVALDSTTLTPLGRTSLVDPKTHEPAILSDDGSASPTVAPNGDVYFGVLENPFATNHDRGWLLHFTATLETPPGAVPGAFGWDDTASVVPSGLVPSYTGSSPYLLMTKYNNYAGEGGDGVNKIAIVDPFNAMVDPISGIPVMNEVLTIAGVTPDPNFPELPGAVREWCINDAAVDPFTGSVIANSEDGTVYRWDLASNTFTEAVPLTQATGEAYTPTVIGPDGTAYAINRSTLFAVGQ